jgi:hypothetical protein
MKKIITVILCTSLLLMSCKKEKTISASIPNTGFAKLKELSNYYNGILNSTDVYTYDSEGRIASFSSNKEIHLFEYTGNDQMKVTSKSKETGEIKWIQMAKLNGKGAITEIIKRNQAGTVIDAYYYKYDVNGYMSSYKYVSPIYGNDVQERFFIVENGNVVSAKSYQNGVHLQNYYYECNLIELSRLPRTADFYWMSETLYGKPNKNPRKSMKVKKASDGTLTFHAVYSSSFKSEENILEENIEYPVTGTSGSFKYKFQ